MNKIMNIEAEDFNVYTQNDKVFYMEDIGHLRYDDNCSQINDCVIKAKTEFEKLSKIFGNKYEFKSDTIYFIGNYDAGDGSNISLLIYFKFIKGTEKDFIKDFGVYDPWEG